MQRAVIASLVILLCAGCFSSGAAKWQRKAANIPLGTPKRQVERLLPPTGPVLDLRNNDIAGPVTYWLDDKTIVRMWYEDNCLARPVVVETLPDRKVVNKNTSSRPGIHSRAGGDTTSSR